MKESANVLFREDSFAMKVVSNLLFGDLGRKYLYRLVSPLVKNVIAIPTQLDVRRI
jgi:hypothetical protein